MNLKLVNILLADDDTDDCFFFKEALSGLIIPTRLTTVHDGEQLMQLLTNEATKLPDILFLDLNMPRKNGFECLSEIKKNEKLKDFPVIIFSTSYEQEVVNRLYRSGANYFIRKPSVFMQFKEIILHAIVIVLDKNVLHPPRENFVLILKDSLEL
jgi:CheY-like chemotaxis protein